MTIDDDRASEPAGAEDPGTAADRSVTADTAPSGAAVRDPAADRTPSTDGPSPGPGVLAAWWMGIRPKTLSAAVAPVAVGTALAFDAQARLEVEVFTPLISLWALLAALLIQMGTNLSNDVLDFRRGADTSERLGPTRIVQAGLLPARTVAVGAAVTFGMAALIGAYLTWVGGWPILAIGVLAIVSGVLYTAGPYPLAYVGLGDLFVLVFFGIAAVGGTYYLNVAAGTVGLATTIGLAWMPRAIALGISVGALSVAILTVNNLRDLAGDAEVGKRTLAVRLGDGATRVYFEALIWLAFAIPVGMSALQILGPSVVLVLLAMPLALSATRAVRGRVEGRALNRTLAQTARLQMAHAALLVVALVLDGVIIAGMGG